LIVLYFSEILPSRCEKTALQGGLIEKSLHQQSHFIIAFHEMTSRIFSALRIGIKMLWYGKMRITPVIKGYRQLASEPNKPEMT
jgi:hypothetical protein